MLAGSRCIPNIGLSEYNVTRREANTCTQMYNWLGWLHAYAKEHASISGFWKYLMLPESLPECLPTYDIEDI